MLQCHNAVRRTHGDWFTKAQSTLQELLGLAPIEIEGVTMPCWSKILRGMDRDPRTKVLIVRNLARHLESLQQVASH